VIFVTVTAFAEDSSCVRPVGRSGARKQLPSSSPDARSILGAETWPRICHVLWLAEHWWVLRPMQRRRLSTHRTQGTPQRAITKANDSSGTARSKFHGRMSWFCISSQAVVVRAWLVTHLLVGKAA